MAEDTFFDDDGFTCLNPLTVRDRLILGSRKYHWHRCSTSETLSTSFPLNSAVVTSEYQLPDLCHTHPCCIAHMCLPHETTGTGSERPFGSVISADRCYADPHAADGRNY